MKTNFIYIFILVIVLSSCSKKIRIGTYETQSSNYSGTLRLYKDKTFYIKTVSCIQYCSYTSGYGKYSLIKDTLVLNQIGVPDSLIKILNKKSIGKFIKSKNTSDTYSLITITVYDSPDDITKREPLCTASLTSSKLNWINEKYYMIDNMSGGKDEDFDGKAEIKVLKNEFPFDITVSYLGYNNIRLIFDDPDFNYEYEINMPDEYIFNEGKWMVGEDMRPYKYKNNMLMMNNQKWTLIEE